MERYVRFSFICGLVAGLSALIGAFCLAALDMIAPEGTSGNREAVELAIRILTLIFMILGFVLFFGAIRELRQTWGSLSLRLKVILMGTLVATSFFGSYVFFVFYPRIRRSLDSSQ